MATTQEKTGADRDRQLSKEQANSESINPKRSSDSRNVDNGENQVSNGTQSAAPAPVLPTVAIPGAETSE